MVHNVQYIPTTNKLHTPQQNTHSNQQNTHSNQQNTHHNSPLTDHRIHQCTQCNKVLASKQSLERHLNICTGFPRLTCPFCERVFASINSLSNHKKRCKGTPPDIVNRTVENGNLDASHSTCEIQNNTVNNNQVYKPTFNLLVFPQEGQDFDFIIDHIKDTKMQKIINECRPKIGFNKFVGEVFENPANRIVQKSNPNTVHSKIHVGDNEWEFALDKDVLPTVTHHMTTAALAKVNAMEDDSRVNPHKKEGFMDFVDKVNTDDECEDYAEAMARIKLILVNLYMKLKVKATAQAANAAGTES